MTDGSVSYTAQVCARVRAKVETNAIYSALFLSATVLSHTKFICRRPENREVKPMVLPTVGRRGLGGGPMKH